MALIYREVYQAETMDEVNERLRVTAAEVTNAIAWHPFFAAQDADALDAFLALADNCNRLAAHEDGVIEIVVEAEENCVNIFLTAPCFLFQIRQIILLQKIGALASEIVFDVTEEENSRITVSFDFSQKNDKLYAQFPRRLFEK